MVLNVFFAKSIIAKRFEYSWIKRMCIFHVLTVRGLSGSEGASVPCMGLPGNAPNMYNNNITLGLVSVTIIQ